MLLNFLPLLFVIAYLVMTVAFFFNGPFDWPVVDEARLIAFIISALAAISFGYFIGIKTKLSSGRNFVIRELNWRRTFKIGAISSIIIFIPATYVYTGKFPWEIITALQDQGDAYSQMLENLTQQSYGREIIAIFRVFFSPWIFAIVPIFILKWGKLNRNEVSLFSIYLICQTIFSLMRGTDKEVADLIIISMAALLIRRGRKIYRRMRRVRIAKKLIIFAAIMVIILAAFNLFSERKLSRLGSSNEFCIGEAKVVCADYTGPIMSVLSENQRFGVSMLIAYLSQGYYGLSIALEEKFESTYGLGHSPFLMSLYEGASGDRDLYQRGYMAKMSAHGWDDKGVWSSAFPWIASDVGFPATLFVVMLLSFLMARTWIDSIKLNDDFAAIVFVSLFVFFIYLPANNQLAQTGDAYLSFWVWMVFWLKSKRKFRKEEVINV